MGNLSDSAVRGLSLQKQKRLLLESGDVEGLLRLEKSIFGGFFMGPEDDDNDSDDDESDDDGDEGDDDEDDDESDESDSRIQGLTEENKRYRKRAADRGKRIRELEAEVNRLSKGKPKGKPKGKSDEDDDSDAEDSSEELSQARATIEQMGRTHEDLLIRLEFGQMTTGEKAKFKFKSQKAALKLLDLSDVEIAEDGTVEGLEEAIADLAESEPYLLEDDADEDDDEKPRRKRRTGAPPARKRNGGTTNRDALTKKYPALQR